MVYTICPGGGGAGIGDPLAVRRLNPGGGGAGIGDPLAVRLLKPGGGGAGIGEPLKIAAETAEARLLDKCLTELLTGSTIKIAQTSKPRRTNMFFVMDEPSWFNHEEETDGLVVLIESVPSTERCNR